MADESDVYKQCKDCNGTGKVMIDDEPYDSGPPIEVDCPACGGTGKNYWGIIKEQEP
jgi:DnaJ-class molecular chaperone